jgi:hypothetical protein
LTLIAAIVCHFRFFFFFLPFFVSSCEVDYETG